MNVFGHFGTSNPRFVCIITEQITNTAVRQRVLFAVYARIK